MDATGDIDDVVRAGRVLFGPRFSADSGWREALRTAWRRRVLETHPDRARALGRSEGALAREFQAVASAYRILSSLAAGAGEPRSSESPPEKATGPRPRSRPAARPNPRGAGDVQARGGDAGVRPRVRAVRLEDMPRRRLRFAEYLYYSGLVRWSELADALAWQRAQRPAVGRLAVEFGFLAPDDVGVILERRREAGANSIPFGEWAMKIGYLTQFQLLAALGRQLKLQRPIGEFFVARGMITPEDVEAVRDGILRHNARCAAGPTARRASPPPR